VVLNQMRQPQNAKRGRGRGRRGNNSGNHNHVPNRNTSYESNGPDVKLRGNAQQLHEKYMALAHDAATSGERISAEAYTQFADHYFRLHQAAVGVAETKRQQEQANAEVDDDEVSSPSKPDNEAASAMGENQGESNDAARAANGHANARGADFNGADVNGADGNGADFNAAGADGTQDEPAPKKRRLAAKNGAAKNGGTKNGAARNDAAKNGAAKSDGAKPSEEDRANLSPAQLAEAVQSDQDSDQVS
jgi:hypothetical protein